MKKKFCNRGINLPHKEMRTDFGDLLPKWHAGINRYLGLHADGDPPWAYNERANVGLLAGAAWSLSNSCALEEYTSTKRVPGKKDLDGRNAKKTGRIDLYVCVRGGPGLACEAKLARPLISSRVPGKKSVDDVIKKAKSAWRSTQALLTRSADKRYALTFVSPRFTQPNALRVAPKVLRRVVSKALDGWLEAVKERLEKLSPRPGYSWVFPSSARLARGRRSGSYPGVMVIIQRQQRARPARQKK